MEVSDELYASVYPQWENPTAPTAQEAGYATEPLLTLWRIEKSLARKSNPGLPIYSPPLYRLSNPGSSAYCYSFEYLTWLCQMETVHYECPMRGVWNYMANIADGYVPLKAFCFLFVCTNENQCLFLTGKYLRCLALRFLWSSFLIHHNSSSAYNFTLKNVIKSHRIPLVIDSLGSCRFYKVLAMVYDIQDYWGFEFCPSFDIIRNNKERNVSETRSVSVLRW
jgi:hypothetical protein